MKKIVLKNESCIGCGACVGIDGEHFTFNEDGYSTIKSQENLDSPALQDAIEACPVAIISLEEAQEEKQEAMSHEKESCQKKECHHEENKRCSCEENGKNCHCHDEEDEMDEAA